MLHLNLYLEYGFMVCVMFGCLFLIDISLKSSYNYFLNLWQSLLNLKLCFLNPAKKGCLLIFLLIVPGSKRRQPIYFKSLGPHRERWPLKHQTRYLSHLKSWNVLPKICSQCSLLPLRIGKCNKNALSYKIGQEHRLGMWCLPEPEGHHHPCVTLGPSWRPSDCCPQVCTQAIFFFFFDENLSKWSILHLV